ncbi:hypothetical protein WICPIJ_003369 [Wickerhamomyces pijperi]|uniref:C2 domain-containing protein n=1 Tax=Wickerhamomyces pijperi TaxID=599730 RepID=A0A9P8Q7Y5_WICPI|nr:hypothetical protein WICPIJ_003369 [Wickerhamomyces pijperi]
MSNQRHHPQNGVSSLDLYHSSTSSASANSPDRRSKQRDVSLSSQATRTVSISSTIKDPHQEQILIQQAYESALKLILIEYQNEARFRVPLAAQITTSSAVSTPTTHRTHKRTPSSLNTLDNIDDIITKENLSILKTIITNIATGVNTNQRLSLSADPLLKRCVLVLYAKLQSVSPTINSITTTDLVGKFMESVPSETKLFHNTTNPSLISDLMMQLSLKFMTWLIEALKLCKGAKGCITKLQTVKLEMEEAEKLKNSNKGKRSSVYVNGSMRNGNQELQLHTSSTNKSSSDSFISPSFRTSDIPDARLLASCFGVTDVQLQQDIFRVKESASKNKLVTDLQLIRRLIGTSEWGLIVSDFQYESDYQLWKNDTLANIDELLSELPAGSGHNALNENTFHVIPSETTDVYSYFVRKILSFESNKPHTSSDPLITNKVQNLLTLVTRYWLIASITQAVTILDCANHTILSDQLQSLILNVTKTKSVFQWVAHIRDQIPDDQQEVWSEHDKHIFIRNLTQTYILFFKSLKLVLSGIFTNQQDTITKLRAHLSLYYGYIEVEPFFKEFILPTEITRRYMTKLKNTFLKASEEQYKSMLDSNVPRDETLSFDHIHHLASVIYETVQGLSTKVSKFEPLLDRIGIVQTVGVFILKCFAEDLSNIHTHIIRCSKGSNVQIDFNSALDCYVECCSIRELFVQITNDKFPYDLEANFNPYLRALVKETCGSILPHIRNIINTDDLKPLDSEHQQLHSSSILYVFKMLNQYVALWDKFEYLTASQYGEIYTSLFGAVSEGLIWYLADMRGVISRELELIRQLKEKEQTLGKTWDLNNLKAQLLKIQDKEQEPVAANPESNRNMNFTEKLCVALNNIEATLKQLVQLEEMVDIQAISDTYIAQPALMKAKPPAIPTHPTKTFITVRVVRAENIKPCDDTELTSAYVVLSDQAQLHSNAKPNFTKTSKHTLNPYYDESFEYEVNQGDTLSLLVAVWNQSSSNPKRRTKEDLCGRCVLSLNTQSIATDGTPQELTLELDTKDGSSVVFEVSCERELQGDIVFSLGKCHRFGDRVLQGCVSSIVDQFSEVIYQVISRESLKNLMQNKTLQTSELSESDKTELIIDSLNPLFHYLNSQFDILARTTTQSLLFQVMIKTWETILTQFDKLILPALASVKVLDRLRDKFKLYNAKRTLYSAWANVKNTVYTPGFGTSLSEVEMKYVFIWLEQLLLFFHNDGAGPDLDALKNTNYQTFMIARDRYGLHEDILISQIHSMDSEYYKALRIINYLPPEEQIKQQDQFINMRRIARSNTIMAHGRKTTLRGSFKRRNVQPGTEPNLPPLPMIRQSNSNTSSQDLTHEVEAEVEVEDQRIKAITTLNTEDIILRILLAKDESSVVMRRIYEREKLKRKVMTERLSRLAMNMG